MNAYWQDDCAAVSVNNICTLAGVSKPSLYREFGSEDGLTAAVLARYSQAVLKPLETLLSSPTGYTTKLDNLISFASENPSMETGCLFVKMRASRSRFGAQTQASIAAIEAHMLECYASFFQHAISSGDMRSGIPAEVAAPYLYEQMGLSVSQRAAGRSQAEVRELLELSISVLRSSLPPVINPIRHQ